MTERARDRLKMTLLILCGLGALAYHMFRILGD